MAPNRGKELCSFSRSMGAGKTSPSRLIAHSIYPRSSPPNRRLLLQPPSLTPQRNFPAIFIKISPLYLHIPCFNESLVHFVVGRIDIKRDMDHASRKSLIGKVAARLDKSHGIEVYLCVPAQSGDGTFCGVHVNFAFRIEVQQIFGGISVLILREGDLDLIIRDIFAGKSYLLLLTLYPSLVSMTR